MLHMRTFLGLFFIFICFTFCYLAPKNGTPNWLIITPWENSESHSVATNCCFKTIADYTQFGALQCSKIISEDPIFSCFLQHVWLGLISRESSHVTDLCARAVFPFTHDYEMRPCVTNVVLGLPVEVFGVPSYKEDRENRGVKQNTLFQTKTWVVTKSDY